MAVFLAIFVSMMMAVSAVLAPNPASNERIVGGSVASEGAFPYQVYKTDSFIHLGCGGSIIDSTTILTGAHCVSGIPTDLMSIWVGKSKLTSGGVKHAVDSVVVHENYSYFKYANDIALVKLKLPIKFSDKVQPIELETEDVEAGVDAVVSGWGRTTNYASISDELRYLNTKTISNDECYSSHEGKVPVKDFHICTLTKAGEGVCSGDNGGPLVANNRVIGISIWGYPCALGKGDLFMRVSYYKDWIAEHRV